MVSHPWRAPALRRWGKSDPVLAGVARSTPAPRPSLAEGSPFEALVQSIAHQQVSIQAGASIFARVRALGCTPEGVLKVGPDALRAAGLSRPKVAYVLDLAERARSRSVDFEAFGALPDEAVLEQLTSVKGIGDWTAKMFLLFHLRRPDVLPHEDLGLQVSVSQVYGVPRSRAAARIRKLGPSWSPFCSYASLVLWNARRVAMGAPTR